MSRLFSRRLLAGFALVALCMPALVIGGCRGEVDDEGASLDIAGGAGN